MPTWSNNTLYWWITFTSPANTYFTIKCEVCQQPLRIKPQMVTNIFPQKQTNAKPLIIYLQHSYMRIKQYMVADNHELTNNTPKHTYIQMCNNIKLNQYTQTSSYNDFVTTANHHTYPTQHGRKQLTNQHKTQRQVQIWFDMLPDHYDKTSKHHHNITPVSYHISP
jgi:hypothetical protein